MIRRAALLALLLLTAAAHAGVIAPDVLDALARGERVRVIVALRAPRPRMTRTRARLDDLSAGAFRVTAEWDDAGGVAGEMTAGAITAMATHPDVLRIDRDRGGRIELTDGVTLIGATAAHARGLTGDGVTVATIDSGVDATHPDLAGAVVDERCWCRTAGGSGCCPNRQTTQSGPGAAADENGHGTHVAGIIASRGVLAPPGVAPGVKLVTARITDATGEWAYTSQLLSALEWLLTDHAEVRAVNISLGAQLVTRTCDTLTADAIVMARQVAALRARGTAVIASAGNDASSTALRAPACLSEVWSVGAVYAADYGGLRWPDANCTDFTTGADTITCFSDSAPFLDFLAPGARITSSWPGGATHSLGGTSMAAPHVTGAAALLFALKPSASVAEVEQLLKDTGKPVADPRNGIVTPRIDVDRAVALLLPPPAPAFRRRAAGH